MPPKVTSLLVHPLLRQFGSYLFFAVAAAAVPLLALPLLTHTLTPADYGLYGLSFALIQLLTQFLWLGLPSFIGQRFHAVPKPELAQYIFTCLVIGQIGAGIAFVALCLAAPFLAQVTSLSFVYFMVMLLIAIAQNIGLYLALVWQFQEKATAIGIVRLGQNIFTYGGGVGLILVVLQAWQVLLLTLLVSSLVVMIYALYWLVRQGWLVPHNYWRGQLRDILTFSLPLMPFGLANVLMLSTDRFAITALLGTSETGIYTAAYQVSAGLLLATTALERAWSPFILKKLNRQHPYQRNTWQMVLFICVLTGFYGAIAPLLLRLLTPEIYHNTTIVTLLVLGLGVHAIYKVFLPLLMFQNRTRLIGSTMFGAALLNIYLNVLLIPLYGTDGAAWATLTSYSAALGVIMTICFFSHKKLA